MKPTNQSTQMSLKSLQAANSVYKNETQACGYLSLSALEQVLGKRGAKKTKAKTKGMILGHLDESLYKLPPDVQIDALRAKEASIFEPSPCEREDQLESCKESVNLELDNQEHSGDPDTVDLTGITNIVNQLQDQDHGSAQKREKIQEVKLVNGVILSSLDNDTYVVPVELIDLSKNSYDANLFDYKSNERPMVCDREIESRGPKQYGRIRELKHWTQRLDPKLNSDRARNPDCDQRSSDSVYRGVTPKTTNVSKHVQLKKSNRSLSMPNLPKRERNSSQNSALFKESTLNMLERARKARSDHKKKEELKMGCVQL